MVFKLLWAALEKLQPKELALCKVNLAQSNVMQQKLLPLPSVL